MAYKEVKIKKNNNMFKRGVQEVLKEPTDDKKDIMRMKIQEDVFDVEDAIADISKWMSLMTDIISKIYENLPQSQKSKLRKNDRELIEHVVSKFSVTKTRADNQLDNEGKVLIDKIMDRQKKVAEIVGK